MFSQIRSQRRSDLIGPCGESDPQCLSLEVQYEYSLHRCFTAWCRTMKAGPKCSLTVTEALCNEVHRRADNSRPVSSMPAYESESMLRTCLVCREKQEREREANGTWEKLQRANNSDPITTTSELLLRQNTVTAHAHQS
jgi:hypothetical protein